MPRLDHPEGCGCAVCLNWQEQLERDRSAREVDASYEPVDRYQPDVEEYHDPDPTPVVDEPEPQVVVEHHHHYYDGEEREPQEPGEAPRPVREPRNDSSSRREQRRTRRELKKLKRRTRRRGFLRSIAILIVGLFVLQSFYPELDVPLLPIADCSTTDPSGGYTTVAAGADPVLWNPFDLGDRLGDLAEEAVGTVIKKAAVYAVGSALNLAGDTVRAMASHPPTIDGIREGLENDVELVGKVVGFTWSALGGETPDALVDLTVPEATPTSSCAPCPTDDGGSVPVGATGARAAAQVAQEVGFAGESAVIAVAVAGAESGWKSVRSPMNDNGTYDHGYWQINSVHAELLATHDWRDPLANARMAWEISDHGTDWTPWTTYKNGDYQQHLDAARAALGGTTVAAMVGAGLVNGPGPEGVQPKVEQAAQFVRDTWNFTGTIHGWRLDYDSEHYKGLAMDVMTGDDTATGEEIARYFVANAEKWGVNNVIYRQRITNAGRGWRWPGDLMEDRGDATANHYDHPHVDFHAGPTITGAPPAPTDAAPAGAAGAATEVCTVPVTAGDPGDGWRVATFNILGAGHTDNIPGRGGTTNPCCPGWQQRWPAQQQLLESKGVSVVGFQEVHREQLGAVQRMAGWDYVGEFDAVTAWREGVWELEDRQYIRVPSLGNTRPMPLVRLRHVESGTLVWFLNVHNSIRNDQERESMRRELAVVQTLPGPMVWMGDFNNPRIPAELRRYGFTTSTPRGIDYIAGRGIAAVNGHRDDITKRTRISDHVIVTSDLSAERGT